MNHEQTFPQKKKLLQALEAGEKRQASTPAQSGKPKSENRRPVTARKHTLWTEQPSGLSGAVREAANFNSFPHKTFLRWPCRRPQRLTTA